MSRINVSTMLLFPQQREPLPDDIAQRLATRHAWVWLKADHSVLADPSLLLGPADFSVTALRARQLHAINPACRVGLYSGGFVPDSHHPHFAWLADADTLHLPDGRPIAISPSVAPAPPGSRRYTVPNYGRPATRAKLIDCWAEFLAAHDLNGVFFDGFVPKHIAGWMRDELGLGSWGGALEGPAHTSPWWAGALSRFTADLRLRLARDNRQVWANGLVNEPWSHDDLSEQITGRAYSGCVDYLDGMLSEHVHRAHASIPELDGMLAAFDLVSARLKPAMAFFQPQLLLNTDPTDEAWQAPGDPELHRFFLACYLLLQSPETLFGYHDREAYRGWDATGRPYLFDGGSYWDRDYGIPTGPHYTRPDGLHERTYSRGTAIVNPTDQYVPRLTGQSVRIWDPVSGPLVVVVPGDPDRQGFHVPPKWGGFIFPA